MHGQTGDSHGCRIGAGNDLASKLDIAVNQSLHIALGTLERLQVPIGQLGYQGQVLIARRITLDLAVAEQQNSGQILGKVGEIRVGEQKVALLFAFESFGTQGTLFVHQGWIQINPSRDRLSDHLIQLPARYQVGSPVQKPAFLEILELLSGHHGE